MARLPDDPSSRLRLFLCHSSGDKTAVRAVYKQLLDDGFEPWLDEEDLLPGQDWEFEITKAVRGSDVVLVFLSKGPTTKTGYLQKEIRRALDVADEQPEGSIFIIPVKLEECDVPERLRQWQWANFADPAAGYAKLRRALLVRARRSEPASEGGHGTKFCYINKEGVATLCSQYGVIGNTYSEKVSRLVAELRKRSLMGESASPPRPSSALVYITIPFKFVEDSDQYLSFEAEYPIAFKMNMRKTKSSIWPHETKMPSLSHARIWLTHPVTFEVLGEWYTESYLRPHAVRIVEDSKFNQIE